MSANEARLRAFRCGLQHEGYDGITIASCRHGEGSFVKRIMQCKDLITQELGYMNGQIHAACCESHFLEVSMSTDMISKYANGPEKSKKRRIQAHHANS